MSPATMSPSLRPRSAEPLLGAWRRYAITARSGGVPLRVGDDFGHTQRDVIAMNSGAVGRCPPAFYSIPE